MGGPHERQECDLLEGSRGMTAVIPMVPRAASANDDDPRAVLRAAIGDRLSADGAVSRASATTKRAKQHLDDCEAKLDGFKTTDSEIAQFRADRVKAWASSGGDRPGAEELPAALCARRELRNQAEEARSSAKIAHEQLLGDLATAKGEMAKCEARVRAAAAAIILSKAGELAGDLRKARVEVARLYDRLSGLGAWWVAAGEGQGPRPFLEGRGGRIIHILQNDESLLRSPQSGAETSWWKQRFEALLNRATQNLNRNRPHRSRHRSGTWTASPSPAAFERCESAVG
jgi:hypothetical protein